MVEDGVTGRARRAAGGSPGGTVIIAYDIAAPRLKADNNRPPAIIWQPPYSSQSVAMADSRINTQIDQHQVGPSLRILVNGDVIPKFHQSAVSAYRDV